MQKGIDHHEEYYEKQLNFNSHHSIRHKIGIMGFENYYRDIGLGYYI